MIRIRAIAIAFGVVALAGACTEDTPTVTEPDSSPVATQPGDAEGDGVTLAVDDSDDHGEILVDGEGRTLYVFLNDEGGESSCTGPCEQNWPPLVSDDDATAGDGVDESLIGSTEREDGEAQVTYNDRPLYHYAADGAAGDTNGQGVGDVWFVVGPDGEPIQE